MLRVSCPPLNAHLIRSSTKPLSDESFHESNTLMPPTTVDVAGSGSLIRTVTVSLAPSCTGDGDTLTSDTVGSDCALASLSAVTSVRAR